MSDQQSDWDGDSGLAVEQARPKLKPPKRYKVVLINDDPTDVLESVEENVESVWTYDSYNDEWFVHRPEHPETSNLDAITPGWGYWVRMYQDDLLVLGGSLFSPITLPPRKGTE